MSEIEFHKFSVDDACCILGSNDEINTARINQIAGPAYTAVIDGKPVGCGGVRVAGVGEAWALYSEQTKETRKELLRHTRYWMDRIIREESLWRLWSECPEQLPNRNFLEHVGFAKVQAFLRG